MTVGVLQPAIEPAVARSSCLQAPGPEESARASYQLGRALIANRDHAGARVAFERAVAHGYRAASIDLGNLLLDPTLTTTDTPRAIQLYESAWERGVLIAAYALGKLYEQGIQRPNAQPFPPEPDQSWAWYHKGADAGEPNALARLAERDEKDAVQDNDPSRKKALLLHAFTLYATAAERALNEEWPDDAWRNWRYRRATLARILGREGLMPQVADAYREISDQWSKPRTLWRNFGAQLTPPKLR